VALLANPAFNRTRRQGGWTRQNALQSHITSAGREEAPTRVHVPYRWSPHAPGPSLLWSRAGGRPHRVVRSKPTTIPKSRLIFRAAVPLADEHTEVIREPLLRFIRR
jgi:hypothetical protein